MVYMGRIQTFPERICRFCPPIEGVEMVLRTTRETETYSVYFAGANITGIYWKCPSPRKTITSGKDPNGRVGQPKAISMWGVVLLNVAAGKEPEFFSNLGAIEQVRHVFYLFNDYEYLVEVEADSPQEMAKVMTNHIRHLPGVERTATFIEGKAGGESPVVRAEAHPEGTPLW